MDLHRAAAGRVHPSGAYQGYPGEKGFVYTYEDKEPFRNAMVHIKEMQIILEEKNTLAEKIERGKSV